ncbi:Lrp/AsnC family transcriptional regulator [Caulobacter sp. NIBR2454]|uniref:Lrp/AsnC family transcriptional regulator n=1 Tax=Caulobacter sp. NIBR2454 TaxID=3015996 RepID=UPI0022B65A92|nr:Lrp/AsnC family transcriptional regulator [Caulobacter sp. NIBR2454]
MTENQTPSKQIAGARDAIDGKLIALLSEDARMTLTALAQKLALSRTAVQARMARLERDKVIVGYRAVIGSQRDPRDEEGLGAVLTLTFSQRPCAPVVQKFRHWPEITNYYSVTGPLDAYVVVRVNTAQDLSQFVDRLSAVEGVASVRSSVILKEDFG